jgi:hypothetical protein
MFDLEPNILAIKVIVEYSQGLVEGKSRKVIDRRLWFLLMFSAAEFRLLFTLHAYMYRVVIYLPAICGVLADMWHNISAK